MTSIAEQFRQVAMRVCDSLAAAEETAPITDSLPAVVCGLGEDELQQLLAVAAALRSDTDAVIAAGAGAVAKLSDRELGYAGLAARKGHRSPAAMIQSITGSSRKEAARQVRLGEAMGDADAAARLVEVAHLSGDAGESEDESSARAPGGFAPVELPWFEPVTRAVAEHALTSDGAAAVIRGMGEACEHCDAETMRAGVVDLLADVTEIATSLSGSGVNADELGKLARQMRDRIDPIGVNERFQQHYETRTWRFNRSATGQRTAWVQFDDESAAWMDSIVSAGMRPRRGGPRFVDPAEAERAEKLKNDPRTDDQLIFDLLIDTLRAGAVADPTTAFGNRQPGIRVIVTKEQLDTRDAAGHLTGTGFFEETGEAVDPATIERMLCDVGTRDITVDENGDPLNVGREQRLFTTKQRLALAYRDGGCMDPACDRSSSYTEAHHIDEWHADHGRTDIADGVQLCRNSHMRIHNQGWKITRKNSDYWMTPPTSIDPKQKPIRMRSKAAWRWKSTG